MNNRRICFALLAGLLAFAAPLYPVRAAINDVFCETNWCEVVQAPSGSITYTNVNIWPETNICLGSSIYAYPEANEMCRDVVTRSVWSPASPNCPTTYSTNLSCPYYVTNWYVVSGPGGHTESGGGYGPFGVVITPTNCGSGTLTFYAQWKNTDPCTGQPTGGGTTSKSVSFKVTHVDIAEAEKFTCVCETTSFSLTNTCGAVTWEIVTNGVPGEPTVSGGTVTAGTNCGTWTVVARSVENTNCADYATVTVVRVLDLTVSEGTLVATNPPTYTVCPVPTNSPDPYITVTASLCPWVEDTNLPACFQLNGGVGTNRLERKVDRRQLGTTTVTATVGCSTRSVVIMVTDTNPPTISGPSGYTVCTDAGLCAASVDLAGILSASDDCGTVTLTFSPASGTFAKGEHTITATATDLGGNTATHTLALTVSDCESPVISGCPADITTCPSTNGTNLVMWTPPTGSDNCPGVTMAGSHASGANFPLGETTVTYTATDASGNQSTCSFKVKIEDLEPPVITCPADITICASPTGTNLVTWTMPTATDNCAVTNINCNPTNGSNFHVGETTVTCTARDVGGNTATCTFKVKIFGIPQAFRDAACTKLLDDWPGTTNQLRSPKYIFGKEDDIYVRVNGPAGLGNDHVEALVTSESYGTGVYLKLHEVSSGVYRNTTTYPSRVLRLGDGVYFETGHVAIKVADEELLTFSLVVDGNSMGCSTNVMVDRGEWMAAAASEDAASRSWNDHLTDNFNQNLMLAQPKLNNVWKWSQNGYFLGKDYSGPSTTQADQLYEEAKIAALTAGASNSYSAADILFYSGHGGGGIFAPSDSVANSQFNLGTTWSPDGDGSHNTWGREVEFIVANGCEQLGDAPDNTNYVARWMTLFNSGIHAVLGSCDQVSAEALDDDFEHFVDNAGGGTPVADAWISACLSGYNTPYGVLIKTNYLADKYNEVGRDVLAVAGTYKYFYYNGNQVVYSHASTNVLSKYGQEFEKVQSSVEFEGKMSVDSLEIAKDEPLENRRSEQFQKQFSRYKKTGKTIVGWQADRLTRGRAIGTTGSADDAKNLARKIGVPVPDDFELESDGVMKVCVIDSENDGTIRVSDQYNMARVFSFVRKVGGKAVFSSRYTLALRGDDLIYAALATENIESRGRSTVIRKASLVDRPGGYRPSDLRLDLVYLKEGDQLRPYWRVIHRSRGFLFDAVTGKPKS